MGVPVAIAQMDCKDQLAWKVGNGSNISTAIATTAITATMIKKRGGGGGIDNRVKRKSNNDIHPHLREPFILTS